jgi:hypothetical protein
MRCIYCHGELHQFRRRIGGAPINNVSADELTRSIQASREFARAALRRASPEGAASPKTQ